MTLTAERRLPDAYVHPAFHSPLEDRPFLEGQHMRPGAIRSCCSPPTSSTSGTRPLASQTISREPADHQVSASQPASCWNEAGATTSLPYETPIYRPVPGIRNEQVAASQCIQPKSLHKSKPSSSSSTLSPAVAMPGTMSARAVVKPKSSRSHADGRSRHIKPTDPCTAAASEPISQDTNMKARFKDLFKRTAIVDEDVESMRGHHWTDEDY